MMIKTFSNGEAPVQIISEVSLKKKRHFMNYRLTLEVNLIWWIFRINLFIQYQKD